MNLYLIRCLVTTAITCDKNRFERPRDTSMLLCDAQEHVRNVEMPHPRDQDADYILIRYETHSSIGFLFIINRYGERYKEDKYMNDGAMKD